MHVLKPQQRVLIHALMVFSLQAPLRLHFIHLRLCRFATAAVAIKAVILVLGVLLAWRSRKIPGDYNGRWNASVFVV